MPDPFPIPQFRFECEKNLAKKVLIESDRKYMVQTLSTVLMTYEQQPSLSDCGKVAKSLMAKYQFLDDDDGGGEVSIIIENIMA